MHNSVNNLTVIQQELSKIFSINMKTNPKIVAVTKTFGIKEILPMLDFGHLDFGENKVQEAIEKWSEIKIKYPNINLHMLGKVQTNKVKYLLPLFDYIHSLDNLKLAEKISNEEIKKNKKLKIFIQVNIGNETQKNGIAINELKPFYEECVNNLGLNIIGLMCLPPKTQDPTNFFLNLKNLAAKLNLKELSMGMSEDYLKAVKMGATYLRIGSKIFGDRI